ncbi:MAG: FKBP-type peptidylprolyl isomerase [Bacteroidetes bacterium OLB12]|nr:MAG: FKBP-type peptidylprolyl isomerase [Bacteroidetes bacterium OLB12]
MKVARKIMAVCWLPVLVAGLLLIQSCKDDDDDKKGTTCTKEVAESRLIAPSQAKLSSDSLLIVQYLENNEIDIADTEIKNNVRYRVTESGTGETPCLESYIKVKYRGSLMKTGYIFDPDQETQPDVNWQERETTFLLSNLVLGWQIVLPEMPVGSKFTMYIPSGYGYGLSGGGGGAIPVNANLIFDVELVEIVAK